MLRGRNVLASDNTFTRWFYGWILWGLLVCVWAVEEIASLVILLTSFLFWKENKGNSEEIA